MFINDHLPPRLQQPVQLPRHLRRLRHRAQHLHARDRIHAAGPDAVVGEFRRVLDPARDDGVHVAKPVLLNRGPQRVVQVEVRLDAVDAVDFRHIVAGQLVAAAGPDLEDRAVGFVDEGGEVSLELADGDHFICS